MFQVILFKYQEFEYDLVRYFHLISCAKSYLRGIRNVTERRKNGDTPKKNVYRKKTSKPIVWFVTLPKKVWTCMVKTKERVLRGYVVLERFSQYIFWWSWTRIQSRTYIYIVRLACWTLAALLTCCMCVHSLLAWEV